MSGIRFIFNNGVSAYQNRSYNFVGLACYKEETKILCFVNGIEKYVNIEKLKKGDLVKTLKDGYKKIDLIGKNTLLNNPNSEFNCLYKIYNNNGEILYITGEHLLLVDNIYMDNIVMTDYKIKFYSFNYKIDDYKCVLACDFGEKVLDTNNYNVYHFVLESNDNDKHYGIYANGIKSESTSKNNFIKNNYQILN